MGIRELRNCWRLNIDLSSHWNFYRNFRHLLSDMVNVENILPDYVIKIARAKILLLQDICQLLNDTFFYQKENSEDKTNGTVGLEMMLNGTRETIPILLFTKETWERELHFTSWDFSVVQITFRRGKQSGIFLQLRPAGEDDNYYVNFSFYGLTTVIQEDNLDHLRSTDMCRTDFLSRFRSSLYHINRHFISW